MNLQPFHLAVKVRDIAEARAFYGGILRCPEGRSADNWVDFDFYGHQLVCHLAGDAQTTAHHNPVDDDQVPVPHFGVVLEMASWQELARRLRRARVKFLIEPQVRFRGQPGEQATLFICDPTAMRWSSRHSPTLRASFSDADEGVHERANGHPSRWWSVRRVQWPR